MNEKFGLNDQGRHVETGGAELLPEVGNTEDDEGIKKKEAIAVRHGYRITFDSRPEAEAFIKAFWTENFPEIEQNFESGMLNPAIHDQITHHSERTDFYIGRGGVFGEVGQFTVVLAGNGQMLKPKSVDWLVDAGYLKITS